MTTYVLLTDAPPMRHGGHGCHVLSWNWLVAMGPAARLVITHRLHRRLRTADLAADLPVPAVFYPDGCGLPLGRVPAVRVLLDWLLFLLALPRLRRAVRASGAERIFALFGADAAFLLPAVWLARATGLPLDVYLVDDLESSTRTTDRQRWVRVARALERWTLRRAARVFAISPGYVEHLREKYGVMARWLPVVAAEGATAAVVHAGFRSGTPDVRHLVFVGSVNFLYIPGLRDLLRAIAEWNAAPDAPFALRLKVLTRHAPQELRDDIDGQNLGCLDVVLNADDDELDRHLRSGWATFLPYSFAAGAEVLVRTSFSSKFTDSLAAGRPILVYGPAEASLPRYFRDSGLPLCATSPTELRAALRAIAAADTPELIARYAEIAERYHSPAALRSVLQT